MKANPDFTHSASTSPGGLSASGRPYRILLIDDSAFSIKQLSQILTSEGYKIVGRASNGWEGLEKFKEIYPNVDLVTMDIIMPEIDGITCLAKILEFDPDVKVVMISSLGKENLVKKAMEIGAKSYIVKPLNRKKVLDRVAAVLQESR